MVRPRLRLPSDRLLTAILAVAAVITAGTAGYMAIAGMSFIDALYQTVTTLSTVGFREVAPFGTVEKLFTVALILVGVGTVLYTFTLVVQQALEGDVRTRFYRRRTRMRIESLAGHYILCGFGRVGREIARELHERQAPFVIIEQNHDEADVARSLGYLVIDGDASDEVTLGQAGIRRARSLLAASDSDTGNTFITLSAKSMNPGCYVVARVAHPYNEDKLRLAGANRVLSLYTLGGRRMVLAALQPLAADFMDTLATGRHGDLVLAEFDATDENGLAGQTVGHIMGAVRNATILGIRHRDGHVIVGPPREAELHAGDVLIVLAEERDIAALTAPVASPTGRTG